jgi:DNA-binding transcriptional LysR family regulator
MGPIDWELMPYFLAVVRSGTLRSGARLLGVNYGKINRNIQALEASYGARLFHRPRRGFTLTEAGAALLPLAEDGEKILVRARRQVEGLDRTETGKIRFSMPQMLAYDIVAPIIAKFQHAYPDIQVEVRLTSDIENIEKGETDVALRGAFELHDDVVARKLFPIAIAVYASETYARDVLPKAGPKGAGLSWIGVPQRYQTNNWLQQSEFANADMHQVMADGYMRLCLLRQGCGLSYLPVIFESIFPDIRRVPGTEAALDRSLWIVSHQDLGRTVRVRRFVDFLAREMNELGPQMQGEFYRK